jgi:hypothetical protein
VQLVSNTVKWLAVRVGNAKVDVIPDDAEDSFEQLYARLEKTVAILNSLSPTSMDGDINRDILMQTQGRATFKFTAINYVFGYAIPKFYLHFSTAYCTIRTFGVSLTDFDYLDNDKSLFVVV